MFELPLPHNLVSTFLLPARRKCFALQFRVPGGRRASDCIMVRRSLLVRVIASLHRFRIRVNTGSTGHRHWWAIKTHQNRRRRARRYASVPRVLIGARGHLLGALASPPALGVAAAISLPDRRAGRRRSCRRAPGRDRPWRRGGRRSRAARPSGQRGRSRHR